MLNALARNWGLVVARGIAAIVFGVLAYLMPGITLASLVLLFGAYALVDGICGLISAARHKEARGWEIVLGAVISIAAGVVTFLWPGITALSLLYLIAAWAIVTGLVEIAAAFRLRKEITGEWMLGLAGFLSLVFGVFVAARPLTGALAVTWLIGAYAIVFGIVMVMLGFRLRKERTVDAEPAVFGRGMQPGPV